MPSKLILGAQHYGSLQTRKKMQKRQLSPNILDEHTCKSSQQNISKLYPTSYHKDHAPGPSMIYFSDVGMVQHIQTNKHDTAYQENKG